MAPERASKSPTPILSTETAQDGASMVTDDEWKAMSTVLNAIYAYRTEEGYDPSKLFQRKVNKRVVPDYYSVIKEPMALSTIKAKIASREYKSFSEFVRDFALIPHNAQVYNRPDSGAYQDALVVRQVLEEELKKLVDQNIVSEEVAKLPFLGEIPPHDDVPVEEEAEEEEEDEDEDDEDEEQDESDEEGGKRKGKRGRRSTAAISKREGLTKDDAKDKVNDPESRKKRGRPPRVDTPMEARIKAITKGLRKPKNSNNQLKISHFERLPDKAVMPEYFNEIKQPIAMDLIKRKLKRKKYQSVEQFMKDVELMFDNAKMYNQDESQIYKDAVDLQKEARELAEQEKKKPDTDYVMEEGRLPMPNGILHNGELWKVGDWVHIQNANDLTKPIVAQIYRTWQDADGGKWVNACWYYRPEQTVHRFDRHFYENEVVKTGQYRDHPIDEVVDRCFVMFFTRYNKGRPRNFPSDKEIYVCEARYNEEKHKLNKIKTWASCLPDEVRDKDYEMDLFDAPKKTKKVPSPIAYLLKDEQKETDDLPKPVWGAENAPPKIGAVHRRPRDPKESPPPEPTPTPPPQPPPPPPRQPSNMANHAPNGYNPEHRAEFNMGGSTPAAPMTAPTPTPTHPSQASYTPHHTQHFPNHPASPAPLQAVPPPQANFPPSLTPHTSFPGQQPPPSTNQYSSPQASTTYQQAAARSLPLGYKAPNPVEVYHLNDNANSSIPEEIRKYFQQDEHGRVLFFTAPPIDPLPPVKKGAAVGHSARYLAAKARREAMLREKREREHVDAEEQAATRKRAKLAAKEALARDVADLTSKALTAFEQQMADATRAEYQRLFPDNWQQKLREQVERIAMTGANLNPAADWAQRWKERQIVPLRGVTASLDDSSNGRT